MARSSRLARASRCGFWKRCSQRERATPSQTSVRVVDEFSDLDEAYRRRRAIELRDAFGEFWREKGAGRCLVVPDIEVNRLPLRFVERESFGAQAGHRFELGARLLSEETQLGCVK